MLSDLHRRHRRALPTVITGDFTTRPGAASIRYLAGLQSLHGQSVFYHDAWELAGEGPGYTWTPDNPGFGYAHPEARADLRNAALAFNKPVDDIWPSDHFGVLIELDVASVPPIDPGLWPQGHA